MSSPERKDLNKTNTVAVLPRIQPQQSLSDSGQLLPARPAVASRTTDKTRENEIAQRLKEIEKGAIEEISKHRISDLQALLNKKEKHVKTAIAELFGGQHIDSSISSLAEVILKINISSSISAQINDGTLTPENLAQSLLHYISQQRSFDCSPQELAMLDSLEFHLMKLLATINPVQRQMAQRIQEELDTDDDAGSGGAEKAEEDKDEGIFESSETEADEDTAVSPRSKKGKARARARDRKNRYKKWLLKMLKLFGRQSTALKSRDRAVRRGQIRESSKLDSPFVKTVRIFGRVTDVKTGAGVEGVKIISSSFGDAITKADGSYGFENVTMGIQYSLAPLRSGTNFSPISINDIALDSREHNFKLIS